MARSRRWIDLLFALLGWSCTIPSVFDTHRAGWSVAFLDYITIWLQFKIDKCHDHSTIDWKCEMSSQLPGAFTMFRTTNVALVPRI